MIIISIITIINNYDNQLKLTLFHLTKDLQFFLLTETIFFLNGVQHLITNNSLTLKKCQSVYYR